MLDAIQLTLIEKLPYAGCHTVGTLSWMPTVGLNREATLCYAIQLALIEKLPWMP